MFNVPSEIRSPQGNSYNGNCLKEVVIERVLCPFARAASKDYAFDQIYNEWIFIVGIFRDEEKYYLHLECNNDSISLNAMIDSGKCPNEGTVSIPKEVAEDIANDLKKIGESYFDNSVSFFDIIIGTMIKIIPCKVKFCSLLGVKGCFNRDSEQIYIANNNSHMGIIFTLIHEFTHFLLKKKGICSQKKIETIGDYLNNFEESICNLVACKVMFYLLHEEEIIKVMQRISPEKMNNLDNLCIDEQIAIRMLLHAADIKSEENKIASDLANEIIEEFDEQFDEMCCQPAKFLQSGLVELSPDDNKKLYNYVMKKISRIIKTY